MIAKFNTGDGWAIIECVKVLTHDKMVDMEEIDALGGYLLFGAKAKIFKLVELTKSGGDIDIVYYGCDAYLMNDNGDTVCSL